MQLRSLLEMISVVLSSHSVSDSSNLPFLPRSLTWLFSGAVLFSRPMFIDLGIGRGVSLLAGLSVMGIVSFPLPRPFNGDLKILALSNPFLSQIVADSHDSLACGHYISTEPSCELDRSLLLVEIPDLLG
jgi:hypothetical protein